MEQDEKTKVTIEATVNSPVEGLWLLWSQPEHITKWNQASEDWHTPFAENDFRTGGAFKSTMAARDGSFSFDFGGTYSNVVENSLIEYVMADGRTVKVSFIDQGESTKIVETFDAETTNSVDMQRDGWQAILDNFKKYAESR